MHYLLVLLVFLLIFSGCELSQTQSNKDPGSYIAVEEGAWLHYQRAGNSNGATVLLVPGWSYGSDVFLKQINYFSAAYDVIAIDPRGQGKSTKGVEHNSYRQHGRDLAAVVNTLQLEQVVFIGWSWGCYDILSFVRQFGTEQIAKFICLDEPPRAWTTQANDWAGIDSLASFANLYQALVSNRKAFTHALVKSSMIQPLIAAELQTLVSMSLQTPDPIALALAVDGMMSDYSEEAIQLAKTVPTFYIIREEAQPLAAPWIAKNLPTTQTLYRGGHFMFWEFPDEINREIDSFIKQIDRK